MTDEEILQADEEDTDWMNEINDEFKTEIEAEKVKQELKEQKLKQFESVSIADVLKAIETLEMFLEISNRATAVITKIKGKDNSKADAQTMLMNQLLGKMVSK